MVEVLSVTSSRVNSFPYRVLVFPLNFKFMCLFMSSGDFFGFEFEILPHYSHGVIVVICVSAVVVVVISLDFCNVH